jgi:glycosyltransferase involved in cell wall biosynthesis
LKIAWFTPLNARSAIAECSRLIVHELGRSCEVDIWTGDTENLLEVDARVIRFSAASDTLRQLERYDRLVYNLGNHHPNHAAIYGALRQWPGVVILHDLIMHHFFMVEYLHERRSPDLYLAEMERSYGPAGRDAAMRSIAGGSTPVWLTDEVGRFPLYERITDIARGVFVHSAFHRQRIRDACLGEIGMSYLPYVARPPTIPRDELLARFGIPADRVLGLSSGIVHPVKRTELVLRAIAADPATSARLAYVLIGGGDPEYLGRMQQLSVDLGIAGSVWFLGYQPPEVLHEFLAAADFAINLRFPNSEGCSLSLVEQMSYGKPALVLDSGMYAEVPEAAVLRIEPSSATGELARGIERLVDDRELRRRMAGAALVFARENFSPTIYAARLLAYLREEGNRSIEPVRACLREVATALSEGGYPIESGTTALEPLLREVRSTLSGPAAGSGEAPAFRTLGVWLGFEHATPLHREGMTRFLCYLAQALIEHHGIDIEIWCYSFNEPSVRESFKPLLLDARYAARVRIVHERNFRAGLQGSEPASDDPDVSVGKNNLYELANRHSRADCFLLGICYLDNALALDRPIYVPMHDLIVLENYRSFVGDNESFRPYARKIREAVEQFNRRAAYFFCNSEHVRRQQLLKYIRHVDEARTRVVYLPVNVPVSIHERIPPEDELRSRFGIDRPYFFYPTQIRHHKNVLTLLEAFKALMDEGLSPKLILTGSPEHVPEVECYLRDNHLEEAIVLARDVPEEVLYGLHAYAAATTVPTLFEGGFPWQALEAMVMGTPAILSNIEAVTERVTAFGIRPDGLHLFEPLDVDALARLMKDALTDRDGLVRRQTAAADALLRYQWKDVAHAYFETISSRLADSQAPNDTELAVQSAPLTSRSHQGSGG